MLIPNKTKLAERNKTPKCLLEKTPTNQEVVGLKGKVDE